MDIPALDPTLANTYAGETAVSLVDGKTGKLLFRGYPVEELARTYLFEEVAYLLMYGELPTEEELNDFKTLLHEASILETETETFLHSHGILTDLTAHPIDVLHGALMDVACRHTLPTNGIARSNTVRTHGITLMAQHAVIIAAYQRIRFGQGAIPADPSLSYAANFLWMLHGKRPSAAETRAMNAALILHGDHGFNASTFAARVAASAGSDIYSCIAVALGTLKGFRHGGANVAVLRMLREIREISSVVPFLEEQWTHNPAWRIPGFGHRIYKTHDPRARVLRPLARAMCRKRDLPWWDIADTVEKAAMTRFHDRGKRDLYCNVDFWSAPLFAALGINPLFFTTIFAMGRLPGLVGHCLEVYENPETRIIRPLNHYTGPALRHVPVKNTKPLPA